MKEHGEYEVARILEVKFKKGGKKKSSIYGTTWPTLLYSPILERLFHALFAGAREFMVRWKDCPPEEDTWEPEENLNCEELIEKFMRQYEKRLEISEKTLREAPKRIERLTYSSGSTRRAASGVNYAGMDED